jgi:hypothetical protein
MENTEKQIFSEIKKHIGNSDRRYDFWIVGNTWEGGFELPLKDEFRNTYSMQRKVLTCSGKVVFEIKQNF